MRIPSVRRAAVISLSLLAAVSLLPGSPASAAPKGPPKPPVTVEIAVGPAQVAPGADADVSVSVSPKPGIKLNKYPKIKVTVPEVPGVVGAAEAAVGNDAPPPPEQIEGNYFKTVEPVRLKLHIDRAASKGKHQIGATVSYFYCVTASGFCTREKAPIEIPVTVR